MADGGNHGVLGQKARAAQRAFEARGMSAGKALRRALSRTADTLWDLALVAQSVNIDTFDQDAVIDALQAGELLVLLDGPEGAVGLAALEREVLTALVEVQTIQQVTQMPVDDRPLTHTDAAMAAPFLDDALKRFAALLDDNPLRASLDGYRFGTMIEDRRAAAHLLNAPGYHAFRVSVDLALGRRSGRVALFLPLSEGAGAAAAGNLAGRHAETMERLPVILEATLPRVSLPLSKAETLKAGDLLPLSADVIDGMELRASRGSHVFARGRLGQMNGMRAVRLNWPQGVAQAVATSVPNAGRPVDDDLSGLSAVMPEGDDAPLASAMEIAELAVEPLDFPVEPQETDTEAAPLGDFEADEGLGDFETMDFGSLEFDADIDAENQ